MGERFSIREISKIVVCGTSGDNRDIEMVFDIKGQHPFLEVDCDRDGYAVKIDSRFNVMNITVAEEDASEWESDELNSFLDNFAVQPI